MKGWSYSNLGAVVKFLSGGTPNKGVPRFWSGNIPWVSSAEMSVKRIRNTTHSITSDGAVEGSRIVPRSTIFAVVRGMSLAKEFRVSIAMREMAFNQDIKAIVPKSGIFGEFLFYYLISQNDAIKDSASEAAHGTKKLDMPVLENWPTPVPPLPIQRKIAAVLSAYDDLIENNNRRIELLEKMGEELYREWFVRLRFPGHESNKIVKGIPEGWMVKPLSDLAHINQLSVDKKYAHSKIRYLDIGSVGTNSYSIPDEISLEAAPGRARRIVRHGDIIWSSVRPGNRCYALITTPPENLIASTGFAVITPREMVPYSYLHKAVTTDGFVEQMVGVAKGAAYPATSFDDFGKAKLLVPTDNLLKQYHAISELGIRKIHAMRQIQTLLTDSRDRLLTRLMSGKIDLESLDIAFPPSMQEAA